MQRRHSDIEAYNKIDQKMSFGGTTSAKFKRHSVLIIARQIVNNIVTESFSKAHEKSSKSTANTGVINSNSSIFLLSAGSCSECVTIGTIIYRD